MTPDILVVGGGLHGCSAALHCALAGLKVVVVEKDYVGRHASGVNAGGVRSLGRHPAEVPLSRASTKLWHSIADLVGDDCGFQASGQVKVAATPEQLDELKRRAANLEKQGFAHEEIVGPDDLYELLPSLAPGMPGGVVVRDDGFANPFRTTVAFRHRAAKLGVQFLEGTRLLGMKREGKSWKVETSAASVSAAVVINCAGAWAGQICKWLGEPAPVEPIAPMMTITSALPPFVAPVVGFAGSPLSFKQMQNGTVMIGGGYRGVPELERGSTRLRLDRLATNISTALMLFPILEKVNIIRFWAGIEAHMPDDIPVIGPGLQEGVFHAFGFSAHGFQLGPIVGQVLAALIQEDPSSLPIEDFAISRFMDQAALDEPIFKAVSALGDSSADLH